MICMYIFYSIVHDLFQSQNVIGSSLQKSTLQLDAQMNNGPCRGESWTATKMSIFGSFHAFLANNSHLDIDCGWATISGGSGTDIESKGGKYS